MDKVILHSDLNNFYASVETALNPCLKNRPIAVCGDSEKRHGIVLAKNELAKRTGIKTGEVIWQAKKKCKDLVLVDVHMDKYLVFSHRVREIYARYTDLIEPYGIDECWLDVTASKIFGDGEAIANKIREQVKEETGLTVSVGVSFTKAFAKLGSDMKKPDAVTVISRGLFISKIYSLPVQELLYVGNATRLKLGKLGIYTIGQLAAADDKIISYNLGKWGETLLETARGGGDDTVRHMDDRPEAKSIGNSMTFSHDLYEYEDIKRMIYVLSESVASRLKASGLGKAQCVHLYVRDNAMEGFGWQCRARATTLCSEIAQTAYKLFTQNYVNRRGVRCMGVTVSDFTKNYEQMTFEELGGNYDKLEKLEKTVDKVRERFGYSAIQRGIMLEDAECADMDVRHGHLVHPAGVKAEADELGLDLEDDYKPNAKERGADDDK